MRAIERRVERLKDRLVPQEDPEANRLVDLLRKRRRERLGNESDHKFTPLPPANTAMKTVERRLDRLEDRLAPQGRKQFLIVVTDAAQKLALDSDRCVQILREAGRIDSASPIIVVDLGCIPDGLNAQSWSATSESTAPEPSLLDSPRELLPIC